jgi:hypothetical protein
VYSVPWHRTPTLHNYFSVSKCRPVHSTRQNAAPLTALPAPIFTKLSNPQQTEAHLYTELRPNRKIKVEQWDRQRTYCTSLNRARLCLNWQHYVVLWCNALYPHRSRHTERNHWRPQAKYGCSWADFQERCACSTSFVKHSHTKGARNRQMV